MSIINQSIDEVAFQLIQRRVGVQAYIPDEIANRLVERFQYFKIQPQSILLTGSNITPVYQALIQLFPKTQFSFLDIALNQLPKQRFWQHHYNLLTTQAQRILVDDQSFDLVVSHLGLLAIKNISQYFQEIYRVLKPEGAILFSTLGPDTLKELRKSFQHDNYPHVHDFFDMHDLGDLLLQVGFQNPVVDMQYMRLQYRKLKTLFHDLKTAGFTNVHQQRRRSLMGKNVYQRALQNYQTLKIDEYYPASFELIYGHAWVPKQALSMMQGGEVAIPISKIGRR